MKIAALSSRKFLSNSHPTRMINKGKNIYNKMPWRAPIHYKKNYNTRSSTTTTLDSSMDTKSIDSVKESLLAGKLSDGGLPGSESAEVPKGHVAVYVGPKLRRFVIPTSYLSMPDFRGLMDGTAEEYGFEKEGALELSCDEEDFQKVLTMCLSKDKEGNGIKI